MSATTVFQGSYNGMAAWFNNFELQVELNLTKYVYFPSIYQVFWHLGLYLDIYCRRFCQVEEVMSQLTTEKGQITWEDSDCSGDEEFCCFRVSGIFVIVLKRWRQLYLF